MHGSCLETQNVVTPAPASREVAVLVENVSKRYSKSGLLRRRPPSPADRMALDNISLAIRDGETIGLLGPNGAGKTTLLKSIASLLEVTEGRILVYGHDVSKQPVRARRSMGLVTCDERSFYWRLTGRQNLEFFGTLYGVRRRDAEIRIAGLFETLGLTEAADRPYYSYSSGMRQKMAIARGLLSDPRLILFDEPTRSLDPLSSANIRKWIRDNRKEFPNTTRLIATNQLDEASQLCDRLVIINRGRVIASGTIEEITARFNAREHVVHRIACRNYHLNGDLAPSEEVGLIDVAEETSEQGMTKLRVSATKDSDALTVVLGAIVRCGGSVVSCETEQVPFDEVFCSVVMEDTGAATVRSGQ